MEGYFSKFGNVDSYGDIVMPGAFTKSFSERGPKATNPRIKHIMNHDISMPIGLLIDLKEDEYGGFYRSKIGTHSLGQDTLKMAESGLITEHSFGYEVIKSERDKSGAKKLNELKVWEISSLTGWGVNQYTPLTGIKSENVTSRLQRLEKFIKNTTATDECIQMLMLEVKQLTQLVIDMQEKENTVPELTTQPEEKALPSIDWNKIINSLKS